MGHDEFSSSRDANQRRDLGQRAPLGAHSGDSGEQAGKRCPVPPRQRCDGRCSRPGMVECGASPAERRGTHARRTGVVGPNAVSQWPFRRSMAGPAPCLPSVPTSVALCASTISRSPGTARCMAPGSPQMARCSRDRPRATSSSGRPESSLSAPLRETPIISCSRWNVASLSSVSPTPASRRQLPLNRGPQDQR